MASSTERRPTTTPINHVLDKTKLLRTFPEEVWMMIFKFHSTSVDLRNVSRSSRYFGTLLLPLRTQWLFTFVWQLILAQFIQYKSNYVKWPKSLLKLRFVCKAWSKGADRAFELEDANRMLEALRTEGRVYFGTFHIMGQRITEKLEIGFILDVLSWGGRRNKERLNQFLEHFQSTHPPSDNRSPLVTKTIFIHTCFGEVFENNSTWLLLHKILSLYGKFMKHCLIFFDSYKPICKMLALMPNVETLVLNYTPKSNPNLESSTSAKINLPKLSHLKLLKIERCPPDIVNDLFREYVNITQFEFTRTAFDISGLLAHPLKGLGLCVNLPSYNILKQMPNSWPLTNLELKFEENCFVEWPELFSLLHQNWNETLQCLKLALSKATHVRQMEQIIDWSLTPLLELKRLNHLTLSTKCIHGWDFILPVAKTLEFLAIIYEFECIEVERVFVNQARNLKKKPVLKIPRSGGRFEIKRRIFPRLKKFQHGRRDASWKVCCRSIS